MFVLSGKLILVYFILSFLISSIDNPISVFTSNPANIKEHLLSDLFRTRQIDMTLDNPFLFHSFPKKPMVLTPLDSFIFGLSLISFTPGFMGSDNLAITAGNFEVT